MNQFFTITFKNKKTMNKMQIKTGIIAGTNCSFEQLEAYLTSIHLTWGQKSDLVQKKINTIITHFGVQYPNAVLSKPCTETIRVITHHEFGVIMNDFKTQFKFPTELDGVCGELVREVQRLVNKN